MKGFIQRIRVFPEKGSAGLELNESHLIEGLGLEGDFFAKGGERQISLLFAEGTIRGNGKHGLCLSRFKENINICFPKPPDVRAGTRLELGEAVLEITGETKHCHEECSLYQTGKSCSLAGLNLFARVLKGGVIRVGDSVHIAK